MSAMVWLSNAWTHTNSGQKARLCSAYRELQKSPFGRFILEDLARYCNLRNASFVAGDSCTTSFNEGQRDVLLHMLEMMDIDPLDLAVRSSGLKCDSLSGAGEVERGT